MSWDELADGVFRRRYESLDLNIGLVLGDSGALVLDTRASHRQAWQLIDDITAVTALPVRWAVNSHWHWDHSFGNHEFAGAALYGHELCRQRLLSQGRQAREDALEWIGDFGRDQLDEVVITPPTNTFTDERSIDLGPRSVVLKHLGKAHTDNDIVMTISDCDIVEESAPPFFGESLPLAWPDTVAAMLDLGLVFVPGHGDVMSHSRVETQQKELQVVADSCVDYLTGGIFDPQKGPYPASTMQSAWEQVRVDRRSAP